MRRARAAVVVIAAALAAFELPLRAEPPAGEIDLAPTPPGIAERLEQIRERVQAAVVYPQAARERGIEGVTRVQFRVDPRGRAAEIVTVESSGSALLDGAAEAAARDATELPQIYGFVRIPVRFELAARGAMR